MNLKNLLKKKSGIDAFLRWQRIELEQSRILNGRLFASINSSKGLVEDFEKIEFSVFSQLGDDGIIQYLIEQINFPNKYFIEFGVQNYMESNTRFLLMNNNWSGLIMDGSEEFINFIKNDYYYWKYNLTAKKLFITKDNINQAFLEEKVPQNPGILHIDIDGNDYWIWKSIEVVNPILVIMEYNSGFGDIRPITVPYVDDFERYNCHFSGLIFGASLQSLCDLAEEKGYYFIGSNSYGNNAYFVKKEYIGSLKPITCKVGYRLSNCRQNKNKEGNFTLELDENMIKTYPNVKVVNTRTGNLENLNE